MNKKVTASSIHEEDVKLKIKIKEDYKEIKSVKCPTFLGEVVKFNSKGLNHIFYKGSRKDRDFKDVRVRHKLLSRAVKLLKIATIHQEENVQIRGDKSIKYWTFEGVIDNRRIKVVIRQIGDGVKHFWSVIPSWRRNRFGNIENNKKSKKKSR